MLVTVDRVSFQRAIEQLAKFRDVDRENRDSGPQPSYIRLEVAPGTLSLQLINVTAALFYKHNLPLISQSSSIFQAAEATNYINLDYLTKLPFHESTIGISLGQDQVDIWSGDNAITISDPRSAKESWVYPYPTINAIPLVDVINGRSLANALKFTLKSVATSDMRPILQSLQYKVKSNGLAATWRLSAADGFRLHVAEMNRPGEENTETAIAGLALQLPGEIMRRLIPQLENIGYVFVHAAREFGEYRMIKLLIGNTEIVFPAIDGKFPDVDRLLNGNAHIYFMIERDSLLTIAKDMARFDVEAMQVSQAGFEGNSWRGKLKITRQLAFKQDATPKPSNITVHINPVYLKEMIDAMPKRKGVILKVRLSSPNNPISIEDAYDQVSYIGVAMPQAMR